MYGKMIRLYSHCERDDSFGFIVNVFITENTRKFIEYAQIFMTIYDKSDEIYQSGIFGEYETKIPSDVARKVYEKRCDLISILFSPFKFLSEFYNQSINIKLSNIYEDKEVVWIKSNVELIYDLLRRCDYTMNFSNITSWNYWYSNGNGKLVVSTGTLNELTNLLKTDLSNDPTYRDVFINTIELYSSVDDIMLMLLPKQSEISSCTMNQTKNILITLQIWMKRHPQLFVNLEKSKSIMNLFLSYNKNDENGPLKMSVSTMYHSIQIENKLEVEEVVADVQYEVDIKDICATLTSYEWFSAIINYVHFSLYKRLKEKDIIMYGQKGTTYNSRIKLLTKSYNWLSEMISNLITKCPLASQSQLFNFIMKASRIFYEKKNYLALCAFVYSFHKIKDFDDLKANMEKDIQELVDKLKVLCSMDDNLKNLREEMKSTVGPMVPFVPILTKDIIINDETFASYLKKTNHYNFNKLRKAHELAQKYLNYQVTAVPDVPSDVPPEIFRRIKEVHGL